MYMSAAHYTLSVDELCQLAMGLKLTLAVKTGINIKFKLVTTIVDALQFYISISLTSLFYLL